MARWVGASLRRRLTGALSVPLIRRVIFHVRRLRDDLDIHFFRSLVASLAIIVTLSALLVTVAEPSKRSISGLVRSAYWAMTMVLGSGDSSYVDGPVGYLVGWALAFFGVAIVAALTAAVAGFVIDFILKEGQGMGASGYIDHIVICGWNPTARELIEELKGDEFKARVVIIHDVEHNPAGSGTYFVRGDPTSGDDLRRAGIEDAAAAVICPSDSSNDADMRSILSVLAIETIEDEPLDFVEAIVLARDRVFGDAATPGLAIGHHDDIRPHSRQTRRWLRGGEVHRLSAGFARYGHQVVRDPHLQLRSRAATRQAGKSATGSGLRSLR